MNSEFQLDKFLPYHINVVAKKLSHLFYVKYKKYDISIAQWRIIAHLGNHTKGLNQKSIAKKTELNKVEVSRNVVSLLERKILIQKKDKKDLRNNIIQLTKEGFQTYDEITRVASRWQEDIFSKLNKSEIKALYSALNKLSEKPS